MTSPIIPLVEALGQAAVTASRQLLTNDDAIDTLGAAQRQVRDTVSRVATDVGNQTAGLAQMWTGQASGRQQTDGAALDGIARQLTANSTTIQGAIGQGFEILKGAQVTNVADFETFKQRAVNILMAAQAAAFTNPFGAAMKLGELITLGGELAGKVSGNLRGTVQQLTGVGQKLLGDLGMGGTTPQQNGSPGTPPEAYNGAPQNNAPPPSGAGAQAVENAKKLLGMPYVWGGKDPNRDGGVDCSGLVTWAYGQAGVDVPGPAQSQDIGTQVSKEDLQPGDLLVWEGGEAGGHVAIYAGDGQLIEAGDPVQMGPLRETNMAGQTFRGYWRPTA
ncbi:NlpC/P60 family protein [Herbihabitans rhizosphaerae]|uniref:NlpC/P60 family protein n=1 Tax=Herbihabitans rhizosphaerae TaxID=1872711 RepID=A0A4Q7KNN7_9PSEU|nr:C40 family peptidase [Herbihabitans rhizosphaerae]RZS36842.1 NlpC/P60 family protein [Herbihabitans rhizosphaerae]